MLALRKVVAYTLSVLSLCMLDQCIDQVLVCRLQVTPDSDLDIVYFVALALTHLGYLPTTAWVIHLYISMLMDYTTSN